MGEILKWKAVKILCFALHYVKRMMSSLRGFARLTLRFHLAAFETPHGRIFRRIACVNLEKFIFLKEHLKKLNSILSEKYCLRWWNRMLVSFSHKIFFLSLMRLISNSKSDVLNRNIYVSRGSKTIVGGVRRGEVSLREGSAGCSPALECLAHNAVRRFT